MGSFAYKSDTFLLDFLKLKSPDLIFEEIGEKYKKNGRGHRSYKFYYPKTIEDVKYIHPNDNIVSVGKLWGINKKDIDTHHVEVLRFYHKDEKDEVRWHFTDSTGENGFIVNLKENKYDIRSPIDTALVLPKKEPMVTLDRIGLIKYNESKHGKYDNTKYYKYDVNTLKEEQKLYDEYKNNKGLVEEIKYNDSAAVLIKMINYALLNSNF